MSQLIKLKRSAVPGKIPTTASLDLGEIAINTNDGNLYFKKDDGAEAIVTIKEVTEDNLAIDTSLFDNSSSSVLSGVLADLDSAIGAATGGGLSSTFSTYEYNVTADQTVFTGSDSNSNTLSYDLGSGTELPKVQVYLNGILLDYGTDYTATNGTSVVLTTAAVNGDVVTISAYKSFSTFNNDLQLADNQKILFGNDLDLQMFHSGTNSVINQVGTGNLLIQKNTTTVAEFTADGLITDSVQFTGGTGTQGLMSWNADEETLDLIQNDNILQLGQEVLYNVRNNTGSTILNGTPVMATGTLGASGRITVAPMDGTNVANAQFFLGVATTDILDDTDGKVTHFGKVRGIDTSAYTNGSVLYISTTQVGQFTATEPQTGMKLAVAFVVTSHVDVGTLMVRATNGLRLNDLNDVNTTGLANNNLLGYNSSTSEWEPIANTTTNIDEGTNLYYTDTRARNAISVTGDLTYNASTGVLGVVVPPGYDSSDFSTDFANKSTTNLSEGTNLYYTDTRANSAIDTRVTKEFVDDLATEITTLATTTETQIASFSATTYGSAKLVIQATSSGERHVTELLVVHNGTTASATEYGTILTDISLFTLDVDINSNNIRILATGASATSTVYKVYKTLIKA